MKYPRNRKLLDFHTAENAFINHVTVEEPLEVDGDVAPVFDVPIPRDVETDDVEALAIKLMHVADDMRPACVMLSLSTGHMPSNDPDFGDLRTIESTGKLGSYGYLVFVQVLEADELGEHLPEWLIPVWKMALECGARLIEFDRDENVYDHLPKYEW
jgi:hypothetical protein